MDAWEQAERLAPFLLFLRAVLHCGMDLLPCGRGIAPLRHCLGRLPGVGHTWFGLAALRARGCAPPALLGTPPRRGGILVLGLLPCGRGIAHLRRCLERLPGAGQRGPVRGCAPPRPPLHSPRNTPKEEPSTSAKRRGHASYAAGASLPRSTRSGDLPPRRVNAIVHFRSDQMPFQPNTPGKTNC